MNALLQARVVEGMKLHEQKFEGAKIGNGAAKVSIWSSGAHLKKASPINYRGLPCLGLDIKCLSLGPKTLQEIADLTLRVKLGPREVRHFVHTFRWTT